MHIEIMIVSALSACLLVGFSQPKPASQQCFLLTINQHQPVQTSSETNQRTGRMSALIDARVVVFSSVQTWHPGCHCAHAGLTRYYSLRPKKCNCGNRADQISSYLSKFIVNMISIYGFK